MRTDVHTHAFHPKIANKAVASLEEHYQVQCSGLGTIDDLLQEEALCGIERVVVLCAATTATQVIPANNYAIQLNKEYENVVAFGTIHPDYADWEAELARLKRHGIQGIKLHPDFQKFYLDDTRLLPIFEVAQHDFIFEIHIGDTLPPKLNPSCPYKMAAVLDMFPKLRVIAAHLGGYRHWEHARQVLVGRDVWLETSSSAAFLEPYMLQEILRSHAQERILFGTDYPLFSPSEEMRRLQEKGGLSEAKLQQFLHNADALF